MRCFRLTFCLAILMLVGCGQANGAGSDGGKGGRGAESGNARTDAGGRPQQPPPAQPGRRAATREEKIRKAYFALEVAPGSDLKTVRDAYQRLMRKYDPALYSGSPDKHRAAIELTQRLTEAYEFLEKELRR